MMEIEATNVATEVAQDVPKAVDTAVTKDKTEKPAEGSKMFSEDYVAELRKEAEKKNEKIRLERSEREALQAKYSELEREVTTYKDKLTQIEKMEKESLLSKLPETLREKYQSFDNETLKAITDDFINANPTQSLGVQSAVRSEIYTLDKALEYDDEVLQKVHMTDKPLWEKIIQKRFQNNVR